MATYRRWSVAMLVLALADAGATEPGEPMRKQDAIPPVFLAGPSAVPGPELDRWLAAHPGAHVKLPFTVWRGPLGGVERAAIGVHDTPPAAGQLRLADSALGIALSERLTMLCGEETRCVVALSGRFGELIGPASADPSVFSVFAVYDRVTGEAPAVEVQRSADCLAIRSLKPLHCARGPARCEDCRTARDAPARPKLLDVCPEGDHARPVIDLKRAGVVEHRVYDVVRTFTDDAEARAFAAAHGIADVELAAER